MATPRAGPKRLVCAGEEQLHKMTCLKHAFAAIRLRNATKRRRDDDDDDDDNANSNVDNANSNVDNANSNVGNAGLANNPVESDATNSAEREVGQLLNDAAVDRERALDMEESWRAYYVSRRRKF